MPVKNGVDLAQKAPTQCEVQMFGEGGYGEKVILEQKEVYYKTQVTHTGFYSTHSQSKRLGLCALNIYFHGK